MPAEAIPILFAKSKEGAAIAKPDLSDLAIPGALLTVRVTPRASANRVLRDEAGLRIQVTAVPEGGKANQAVCKLLAKALGIAKTRLTLVRGDAARDKVFRID